jgi:hypothetical protein
MRADWIISVEQNRVQIGERFALSFQRTLRIPDDGKTYPLPPTLGQFPVHRAADYATHIPTEWHLMEDGLERAIFIPMYQREALWLAFEGASWKPNAVKIGVGCVNALTGGDWDDGLHDNPQNYLVCPNQPWLDGLKTRAGVVRQFVAMPLGWGYTVEAQLTGQEQFGGIQVQVYDPKPGLFPDEPPPPPPVDAQPGALMGGFFSGPAGAPLSAIAGAPQMDMGLAAGGEITQKIYPDAYGLSTWDTSHHGELQVFIVNIARYVQITGEPPPATPVDAQTYTRYGFPWFELYDEDLSDIAPSQVLSGLASVADIDVARGEPPAQEGQSFEIPEEQKRKISSSPPRRSSGLEDS